jgi:O-antigen/teichoic acid export membrane protein
MSVSRNTAYNLAGAAVPILLGLITVPLYLRLIGPDRYGVLAIAWLFLGYFGLFDLGLGRATSFRIASQKAASEEDRAETFWSAIAVNASMGAGGALLLYVVCRWYFSDYFAVSPTLRPELLSAVPLLALSVPVATTIGVLTGALQGRELFREVNAISILSTAVLQIFPLFIAALLTPNLSVLIAAALVARVLSAYMLWRQCKRHIVRQHRFRYHRKTAGKLLSYGGWITVSAIIGPLMVTADRFGIGAILGATAVATYTIPFQLAQRVSVLPVALSNAIFPKLSAQSSLEHTQSMAREGVRILAALMTPPVAAGVFFMNPFLHLWLGRDFATAGTAVGQLALVGWWLNGVATMPLALLHARSRPRVTAIVHTCELLPYFFLLYWASSRFGLPGVAAAFAARNAIDFLALGRLAFGRNIGFAAVVLCVFWLLGVAWLGASPELTYAFGLKVLTVVAVTSLISWFVMPTAPRASGIRWIRTLLPKPAARLADSD